MTRRAQEFFSGFGNFHKEFSGLREELVLINDGDTDVEFIAGTSQFTLKARERFDEAIDPFDSIQIIATGSFRGYVRDEY